MVQSRARLGHPVAAIAVGTALILQAPRPTIAAQGQGRDALSALAREMSTCSGYFALATSVLWRALPEGKEVIDRYDVGSKVLLAQAIAIAEMIELDADAPVAWSRAAMQDMVKEINADPKNSAAFMTSKYDEPCKTLLKDSTARLRALMERD